MDRVSCFAAVAVTTEMLSYFPRVMELLKVPVCPLNLFFLDKYTFTLIGYALLYYIGEILRRGTHNLSYIYGNACINIAYPYTKVFSHTIKGRFCVPPRKTSPILYRKDFAYPRAEHLPYYIGRILRTPRKTSPICFYYM